MTTSGNSRLPPVPLLRHTFACALATRGGVCDCQPGYDPRVDPWPQDPAGSVDESEQYVPPGGERSPG